MKWFHSDGHTQTYIPKKHREYAQQLAYKRFLLEKQTECKKELYALELYQRHAVGENKKSDRFLSEDPAVYEIRYDDEIPFKVAVNEAVELAKQYGTNDSPAFVNGILAKFAE